MDPVLGRVVVVFDVLLLNVTGVTSSGVVVSMLLNSRQHPIAVLPDVESKTTDVSVPSATLYRIW